VQLIRIIVRSFINSCITKALSCFIFINFKDSSEEDENDPPSSADSRTPLLHRSRFVFPQTSEDALATYRSYLPIIADRRHDSSHSLMNNSQNSSLESMDKNKNTRKIYEKVNESKRRPVPINLNHRN
jgi:hypothetical protein